MTGPWAPRNPVSYDNSRHLSSTRGFLAANAIQYALQIWNAVSAFASCGACLLATFATADSRSAARRDQLGVRLVCLKLNQQPIHDPLPPFGKVISAHEWLLAWGAHVLQLFWFGERGHKSLRPHGGTWTYASRRNLEQWLYILTAGNVWNCGSPAPPAAPAR
jgi:hypothetical protein